MRDTLLIALAMLFVVGTLVYWNSQAIGQWLMRRNLHDLAEVIEYDGARQIQEQRFHEQIDAFVDGLGRRVDPDEFRVFQAALAQSIADDRMTDAELDQLLELMRSALGDYGDLPDRHASP